MSSAGSRTIRPGSSVALAMSVLAIVGLRSADPRQMRAACIVMDLTTWSVIVPLCLTTLVTGISRSLATT